jgi:hypothetical protein
VPLGRHSFLNGIALPLGPEPTDGQVDDFVSRFGTLLERIDRLDEWARRVVARNAAFVDPLGGDPTLGHYVTTVQWYAESNTDWSAVRKGLPFTKEQAFEKMRRFIGVRDGRGSRRRRA